MRTVLVTGGSRGIGKAIAEKLGQTCNVAVGYSSSKEKADEVVTLIKENGGKAIAVSIDVTSQESVEQCFESVENEFSSIDILINNAGITKDNIFPRLKQEDWDTVVDTNLTGSFRTSKRAVKNMMKNKWGRIIFISSVAGISGNTGQANYAASKAGLIGFTKSVAQELGSRSIRCNAIAPGFIETEMTAKLDEKVVNEWRSSIPLKRGGSVEDVANLTVFLGSDMSTYITGQTINICGGMLM